MRLILLTDTDVSQAFAAHLHKKESWQNSQERSLQKKVQSLLRQ